MDEYHWGKEFTCKETGFYRGKKCLDGTLRVEHRPWASGKRGDGFTLKSLDEIPIAIRVQIERDYLGLSDVPGWLDEKLAG